MNDPFIRGLSFDPESGGYIIEFLHPAADVRGNGLVLNHALLIPAEEPFEDLLIGLVDALRHALKKGLELHADGPGLDESDDDDDEPGPYDNPEER